MQQAVMDGLVSCSKESRRITIRELCETLHTLVILQLVARRLERQVVTVVAEPKSHYRVVGELRDDGGCRRRRALVNDQWTIKDRKSTHSSHLVISYAVFCLKKKKSILKVRTFDD